MPHRIVLLGIVMTSLAVATLGAHAADLDPGYADIPAPIPQQQVTFGSGWYVRGDISGNDMPSLGVGTPSHDAPPPMTFDGPKKLGYAGTLGGGYSFTNGFRADVVFDYRKPLNDSTHGSAFSCQIGYNLNKKQVGINSVTGDPIYDMTSSPNNDGSCTGFYNASLNSYDALINAYYDLGTWYGVTPYVGAGVGVSFGHYHTSSRYLQADGTSYDIDITEPVSGSKYHIDLDKDTTGDYYNLAWALMAGFAYDITSHAKLDIGYRYVNLGRVLGTQYTVQEARAGLRYMIDN